MLVNTYVQQSHSSTITSPPRQIVSLHIVLNVGLDMVRWPSLVLPLLCPTGLCNFTSPDVAPVFGPGIRFSTLSFKDSCSCFALFPLSGDVH